MDARLLCSYHIEYYAYYVRITLNIKLSIKCAPACENYVTHTIPNEFAAMVPQNSKPAKRTQSHLNAMVDINLCMDAWHCNPRVD